MCDKQLLERFFHLLIQQCKMPDSEFRRGIATMRPTIGRPGSNEFRRSRLQFDARTLKIDGHVIRQPQRKYTVSGLFGFTFLQLIVKIWIEKSMPLSQKCRPIADPHSPSHPPRHQMTKNYEQAALICFSSLPLKSCGFNSSSLSRISAASKTRQFSKSLQPSKTLELLQPIQSWANWLGEGDGTVAWAENICEASLLFANQAAVWEDREHGNAR
jgi:hypothetical protein